MSPGYMFLIPSEAAFIEAVADHMFPADAHTPGGVDIGINIFIDRALAGSWGKGDRLYLEGPWRLGALDKIE
ncbi:gluconate 2-dehydrogenase subunit 3 family protein [Bradyrhizobium niftali]|nr:gluconate 2-dehydrogenase subunit 3 family protein [Bradyrhizobium niftali]